MNNRCKHVRARVYVCVCVCAHQDQFVQKLLWLEGSAAGRGAWWSADHTNTLATCLRRESERVSLGREPDEIMALFAVAPEHNNNGGSEKSQLSRLTDIRFPATTSEKAKLVIVDVKTHHEFMQKL